MIPTYPTIGERAFNKAQMQSIYQNVGDIIDNLDDAALKELMSGTQKDMDILFEVLLKETAEAMYCPDGVVTESSFDYLPNLTAVFEDTMRKLSLAYFGVSVLPAFDMAPHILEWTNMIQMYRLLCIEASRGHSKSYSFSFLYPLWKMYRYSGVFGGKTSKDLRLSKFGMLVTNEIGLAKSLLGLIKEEIEKNSILREALFPGTRTGWNEESIDCKNGATFMVKSYGSKMRGFHPTYMIVDDFLAENVMYSIEQKEKYNRTFHSVIMNMIVKDGQVCVVGTPFVQGDLYEDLKNRKEWAVFEYPGIFPDGTILWENMHTYESLMKLRDTIGSINFSREILVRPISEFSSILSYDSIRSSYMGMDNVTLVNNIYSHPHKAIFKKIITGMDFALSSNVGADNSVFMTIGVDDADRIWLLNVFRGKGLPYDRQIAEARRIRNDFNPDLFVVETNQAQSIFAQELENSGFPVLRHTTGEEKHSFSEGIPALSILFEQGRIRLPRGDQHSREMTDLLTTQLMSITYDEKKGKLIFVIDHDDDAMAFWQACRGTRHRGVGFNYSFIG